MARDDEGRSTVLLADPRGRLQEAYGEVLRRAGYQVATVDRGCACLDAIGPEAIGMVASVNELPDLSGIQLVRSIRLPHPRLPFILVPEDGSEALASEAMAAGATRYLPLATDPEGFVRAVRSAHRQVAGVEDTPGHRQYRHVIEAAPVPINVFDPSGTSIWCNDAVVELLDLAGRHELIGRSIFEYIHPDDHDLARGELARVIEDKEATGPTRLRLRTADGTTKHVDVSTAIGRYLGTDIGQAIVVDVTERVQRDRQLQVLEQWLRHNIRNEVTVIRGYASELADGSMTTERAARVIEERAAHLIEQANRQRSLVRMLRSPPAPIEIDLVPLLEERIEALTDRYPHAALGTDLIPTSGMSVEAVPSLSEAIEEVMQNGIAHNDADDPRVRVGVARTAVDDVRISITDNGPGMPDHERRHIDEDRPLDQLHHGRGLGLLFVAWVVHLSDGQLRFETDHGDGTTVEIVLSPANA